MFKRLIIGASALGVLTSALPADAAVCGMRDTVVDRLQSKYSEVLTAGGLQTTQPVQNLVEVWSSPKTGTFTVILTNPSGVSCIVATGTDWFQQSPIETPAGQPS